MRTTFALALLLGVASATGGHKGHAVEQVSEDLRTISALLGLEKDYKTDPDLLLDQYVRDFKDLAEMMKSVRVDLYEISPAFAECPKAVKAVEDSLGRAVYSKSCTKANDKRIYSCTDSDSDVCKEKWPSLLEKCDTKMLGATIFDTGSDAAIINATDGLKNFADCSKSGKHPLVLIQGLPAGTHMADKFERICSDGKVAGSWQSMEAKWPEVKAAVTCA